MAKSIGIFPNVASTDDDAVRLTTSYQSIVGLGTAKTAQLNIVATLSSESDEVIIQVQKDGVTQNLTYGWNDFNVASQFAFAAGTYRLAAYTRGFGISAARIGLSSTASDIKADFYAVC